MRSVPHRVVALLGLDDGVFPRHPETDGDDLLLASPRVGDRDARSEDRQLLLDALLAATEHLIVTYSGHDERTNRVRPPAVPVAELLDAVDADRPAGRRAAGPATGRREPPAAAFRRPELQTRCPLRFPDRGATTGFTSRARAPPLHRHRPAPGCRLPSLPSTSRSSSSRTWCGSSSTRYGPSCAIAWGSISRTPSDETKDALPIDLDALEKWGIGDRLLQAGLAGNDPEQAAAAERARGLLPPGDLADAVLSRVQKEVDTLAAAVNSLGYESGPADSLDIHLDLPDGRSFIGTVPNWRGETVLLCTYSRLAAEAPACRLGPFPCRQRRPGPSWKRPC